MAIMMSLCGELEQLHILLSEMLSQLPEFSIVLEADRDQLCGGIVWIGFIIYAKIIPLYI